MIPLQSGCDPDNPEEHALWALVGLAGPNSHAPLILPEIVQREWSRHLHACGFRHHPELQTIKYVPPAKDTNWVLGAAGEWVDINTPLAPEQTAPDLSHLSDDEKIAVLRQLLTEFQPVTPEEVPHDDSAD